jgi:alkylation response protein AidB-like acyl-CoA dehydrogenase
VLNGTKAWITNGGIADVHVVVAAVDPELKGRGQASFVVPAGTKGLSQGQKYKKHGIKASHTAEVVLDDVRIPGRCLLGGKEKLDAKLARARESGRSGEVQPAMKTFEATRPSSARRRSASLAPRTSTRSTTRRSARRSASRSSCTRRSRSSSPTWRPRSTRPAADLARAWLAQRRLHERRGLDEQVQGLEVAVRVTEEAIQILGGYGYTREYPVERWHRDAKIHTIFEGTSEIQQLVIARAISGLRIE